MTVSPGDVIEKARRSLRSAEILLDEGDFYGSLNRSYYAIFHAASALLLLHGARLKTHSGVRSEFARRFVKANVLPKEMVTIMSRAAAARETSDYDYETQVDAGAARRLLTDARSFLSRAEAHLDAQSRSVPES